MLIWSAKYPDSRDLPPQKKPCSDPCLSPHANLLTHSLHPLPSSKTQPTNAKTPVLTQVSTVMDVNSAWQTRYTNALFVALPDVLLWWKLTSHIPLTLGLLIDGAQLITWTARKSVLDLSSHRNQTLFVTGNSISFTDVTPGLPRNSNNHIILQKISNTQSCNTIDNKFTYLTRVSERVDTQMSI